MTPRRLLLTPFWKWRNSEDRGIRLSSHGLEVAEQGLGQRVCLVTLTSTLDCNVLRTGPRLLCPSAFSLVWNSVSHYSQTSEYLLWTLWVTIQIPFRTRGLVPLAVGSVASRYSLESVEALVTTVPRPNFSTGWLPLLSLSFRRWGPQEHLLIYSCIIITVFESAFWGTQAGRDSNPPRLTSNATSPNSAQIGSPPPTETISLSLCFSHCHTSVFTSILHCELFERRHHVWLISLPSFVPVLTTRLWSKTNLDSNPSFLICKTRLMTASSSKALRIKCL